MYVKMSQNIPANEGHVLTDNCLYNCLFEVKLEKFYENFINKGITSCEKLATLSMVEFLSYGIVSMNDRIKLFQLIQVIKSIFHKDQFSNNLNTGPDIKSQQIKTILSDEHIERCHRNADSLIDSIGSSVFCPNDSRAIDESEDFKIEKKKKRSSSSRSNRLTSNSQARDCLKLHNTSSFENNFKHGDSAKVAKTKNVRDILGNVMRTISDDGKSYNSSLQSFCGDLCICNSNLNSSKSSYKPFSNVKNGQNGFSEEEKPVVVKETVHTKGYNYGLPHNKQSSKYSSPGNCFKNGSNGTKSNGEKVKVCVRKRPRNEKEIKANDLDVVIVKNRTTVAIQEQKTSLNLSKYIHQHVMYFDEVFDEASTNSAVYERTVQPLVSFVLQKGTAVCFSFGQTGAGKTHTLIGDKGNPGLYQLAGRDLFSFLQSSVDASLWVSFYEIYCGQLFDLLNNRKKLVVMEKNNKQVCITGLMETCVKDLNSLIYVINFGRIHRRQGSSGVNPVSSRSHAVLQLDVRYRITNKRIGKLTFIDLAGSERASDAKMCSKQTRHEGAEINQSLLALKECIRSLDQELSYTPYRQSKLTHILRESFAGNCQTVMIANISPTLSACENTMNTLRYADRVQELKRDPPQSHQKNRLKLRDCGSFPSKHRKASMTRSSPKPSPKQSPRNNEDESAIIRHSHLHSFDDTLDDSAVMSPSEFSPSHIKYTSTPLRGNSPVECLSFSDRKNMEKSSLPSPVSFVEDALKINHSEDRETDENQQKRFDALLIGEKFTYSKPHASVEKTQLSSCVNQQNGYSLQNSLLKNKKSDKTHDVNISSVVSLNKFKELFNKKKSIERNCFSQPMHHRKFGVNERIRMISSLANTGNEKILSCSSKNERVSSHSYLKTTSEEKHPDSGGSANVLLVRSFQTASLSNRTSSPVARSNKINEPMTVMRKSDDVESNYSSDNCLLKSKCLKYHDSLVSSENSAFENSIKLRPLTKEQTDKTDAEEVVMKQEKNGIATPTHGSLNSKTENVNVGNKFDEFKRPISVQLSDPASYKSFCNDSTEVKLAVQTPVFSPTKHLQNNETQLVSAHEKHLDSVTQLCREEIDLLMKLRTGQLPFVKYVSKIRGILTTRKQMSDALINHIGQFETSQTNAS